MKNAFAMLCIGAAMVAGAAKADPKADKLFAEGKKHEERATKEREVAVKEMMRAHNLWVAANRNDFEAHVEFSRAFAIIKADKKVIQAHSMRHEARILWHRAHEHMIRAHQDKHAAAVQTHYAAEFTKAAGVLKDTPDIAAGLTADAKRHTDQAAKDNAAATKQEQEAKADHDRAHKLWADAQALDPKTAHAPPPPAAIPAPAAAPAPAPLAAVASAPGK